MLKITYLTTAPTNVRCSINAGNNKIVGGGSDDIGGDGSVKNPSKTSKKWLNPKSQIFQRPRSSKTLPKRVFSTFKTWIIKLLPSSKFVDDTK